MPPPGDPSVVQGSGGLSRVVQFLPEEEGVMPRCYVACPTCGYDRMLLGKSAATFGEPPTATERYYRCKRGHEWTLEVEHSVLRPGVPSPFALRLPKDEAK